MKKSEIIKFLSEKKCEVLNYFRDYSSLDVHLKYLSGSDLKALEDKGLMTFVVAKGDKLLLQIDGNIEWD